MQKIIFECATGSFLYGTNTQESDRDYAGVFLPTLEDVLGLGNYSDQLDWSTNKSNSKNTKDDVDRKFSSLRRFMILAHQGQPTQIEMLFAPSNMVVSSSPEWNEILNNKEVFFCKSSIFPFLGFAKAQMSKSIHKSGHFNLINDLIKATESLPGKDPISKYITSPDNNRATFLGHDLLFFKNEHGFWQLKIANRCFPAGKNIKYLRKDLIDILNKYGDRTKKAAMAGMDMKSAMHCYRLLCEAAEFLKEGRITLPRPPEEVSILLSIKNGDFFGDELVNEINSKMEGLSALSASSPLPDKSDIRSVQKLHLEILSNYHKIRTKESIK